MTDLLLISTVTGLTTVVGAVIMLFSGKPGRKLLAFYLGLSAGIMTLVIFIDLLPASLRDGDVYGTFLGSAIGAVFLMAVHLIVVKVSREKRWAPPDEANPGDEEWRKAGWLMAIALAFHHIPEGTAIGAGFHTHRHVGILIALSMSLHNIPEGIGLAAPLLMSGMGRWRILRLSFLISLCIPAGALIGEWYLTSTPQAITFGMAFAAGSMGYIVWKEIAPSGLRMHTLSAQAGMLASLLVMFLLHHVVP
jgi:ZIP family zinc transporter